ncbi:MAG: 2-C-methyl-D-erythritol 4-phosphate cytidylyltransferase, partial [Peptococcaceae bacterium]|nr:2-C-methyl-D-erythritol 4-phosphate cytidylyltransferase [Peptococcaceae bacterium]
AQSLGNVIAAVPVKDTIKQINAQGRVETTLLRDSLWAVQTPQVFSYAKLQEAHMKAHAEGFAGTDDASLMEWMGFPVYVVNGNYDNLKITTMDDVDVACAILKRRETICE